MFEIRFRERLTHDTVESVFIPTQMWQQLIVGGVSGKTCDVIVSRQHRTRRDITALSHKHINTHMHIWTKTYHTQKANTADKQELNTNTVI